MNMRSSVFAWAVLVLLLLVCPALAGQRFEYRFKRGETWKMSERSETTTEMMGTKMVQRAKRLTVYKITRDLGKGWCLMDAQITAQKNWDDSGQKNERNSFSRCPG
jgi:hypothetical protein